MKKNVTKIMLTLMLALSVLTLPTMSTKAANQTYAKTTPTAIQRSGLINVDTHNSWAFYGRSTPEYKAFETDIDILSLVGYCENGQVDELIFRLIGVSEHNKHIGLSIPFKADGEPETFTLTLPSGEYKISFSGNETIKKTNAIVVFSVEV